MSTFPAPHLLLLLALALLLLATRLRAAGPPRRMGFAIELRPETEARYRELHAATWPGVLERLERSNVRNYSIFLGEVDPGRPVLFGTWEYVGEDYEADMRAIADDPVTQAWWKETDPCQRPFPTAPEGTWWLPLEEVFRHDGPPSPEA